MMGSLSPEGVGSGDVARLGEGCGPESSRPACGQAGGWSTAAMQYQE
jgi:hypothetical protein